MVHPLIFFIFSEGKMAGRTCARDHRMELLYIGSYCPKGHTPLREVHVYVNVITPSLFSSEHVSKLIIKYP